jgi:hypothetical protein
MYTERQPLIQNFEELHDSKELIYITGERNEKYTLKKPLIAMVSENAGEYKVEYPMLELYAFNENKNEAIKELLDDFFDLCDDILPLDNAKLVQYPKYWKEELQTLVGKNQQFKVSEEYYHEPSRTEDSTTKRTKGSYTNKHELSLSKLRHYRFIII